MARKPINFRRIEFSDLQELEEIRNTIREINLELNKKNLPPEDRLKLSNALGSYKAKRNELTALFKSTSRRRLINKIRVSEPQVASYIENFKENFKQEMNKTS